MIELVRQLVERSGLSRERVLELLKEKQKEFKGLISLEGAAYLVAKDLGIELELKQTNALKLGNVVEGMKRVEVVGRIFKITDVKEFERAGGKGKVVNLYIGDETGYVRLPLWDKQVECVGQGKIRVGDVVRIVRAAARLNAFGELELRLGKYGNLTKVEADLPSAEELCKRYLTERGRVEIKDLSFGSCEVKGTVVHVFKGKFLYHLCPVCGCRVNGQCQEHKTSVPALAISGVLDDGTGNVKFVLFKEQAEQFINAKELLDCDEEQRYHLIVQALLGQDLLIKGRVRRNPLSGRVELVAFHASLLNTGEEIKRLTEQFEHAKEG